MTVTPATIATLNSVIQAAKAGDTITLSGLTTGIVLVGAYGTTYNLAGITLDLTGSSVEYLYAQNVNNLTVKGGTYNNSDWHQCLYFANCNNIFVTETLCQNGGIVFRTGTQVRVWQNTMNGGPIALTDVTGFDIGGNATWNANGDGIDLASCNWGRVHHNVISGSNPLNGAHPDAVQFEVTAPVCTHILVDNNFAHGPTQGFDAFNGGDSLWLDNNVAIVASSWGGALDQTTNSFMTNNRVSTLPTNPWQAGFDKRSATNLQFGGNITDAYTAPTGQAWAGGMDTPLTALVWDAAVKMMSLPAGQTMPPTFLPHSSVMP